MRKLVFLFSLLLFVLVSEAADVKFTASAPNAIVMGEQFRLSFTVNAEAKDLRVQEMPDFEVLMAPHNLNRTARLGLMVRVRVKQRLLIPIF